MSLVTGIKRFEGLDNTVLRRTFTPKRDEVVGGWRKLNNEHHNSCSSPNTIRMRWARHEAVMTETQNAH
jgi:hypothetical protein